MKLLVAMIFTLAMTSLFANENSAKKLAEIESIIALQKDELDKRNEELNFKIKDDMQGKIVASMIDSIMAIHQRAESILNSIDDESTISDKTLEVKNLLNKSEKLISQLAL